MSFAEHVASLRTFFGVPDDAPLPVAIQTMNSMMGIVGEGPLPKQVEALVRTTGITLQHPPAAPECAVQGGPAAEAAE